MDIDAFRKDIATENNWRAHVAKYSKLRKKLDPKEYCKKEGIPYEGLKWLLERMKREESYSFYRSFADLYLNRAKNSLELVKKYMATEELRMPLMHDAIVAYVAVFKNSRGRVSNKTFSLETIEGLIPDSLQETHDKLCEDRDKIVAHCDLEPRNPRVGRVGEIYGTMIGKIAGYGWEDYHCLIPNVEELISAVQKGLKKHKQENFRGKIHFQGLEDPPACLDEDPGSPSE